MNNRSNDHRPLVLLDVDGVINDLGALGGTSRQWKTDVIVSHGYRLYIPEYMGDLVGGLVDSCEVWWCTTWRHRANDEIAHHLRIGPLPVVTDGDQSRSVAWKAAAARPLVEKTLAGGREVYWIEDFYGDPPVDELPDGVIYVDTTVKPPRGVLRASDLPEDLEFRVGMSLVLEMLDFEDFETTDPTAGTKEQR